MTSFQFTPQALDDLFNIWSFIAKDNPAAADRVEDAIFRACELLAREPFIGRERNDLTELPVLLGSAAVFQLPDCVPSGKEAAAGGSYSPRRPRSAYDATVVFGSMGGYFFSGRVVAFHVLIQNLDKFGDDVVAL